MPWMRDTEDREEYRGGLSYARVTLLNCIIEIWTAIEQAVKSFLCFQCGIFFYFVLKLVTLDDFFVYLFIFAF